MKAQLKAEVLERCRHFAEYEKLGEWEVTRSWGDKWTFEHYSGDVTYWVDANGLASSPVWGAVAEILGIDQPEARVSDTLLWKAFKFGQENTPLIGQAEFEAWLASLPADPLKADRELVAKYLGICTIAFEHSFSIEVPNMSEALALRASISRLSGLEVPNV